MSEGLTIRKMEVASDKSLISKDKKNTSGFKCCSSSILKLKHPIYQVRLEKNYAQPCAFNATTHPYKKKPLKINNSIVLLSCLEKHTTNKNYQMTSSIALAIFCFTVFIISYCQIQWDVGMPSIQKVQASQISKISKYLRLKLMNKLCVDENHQTYLTLNKTTYHKALTVLYFFQHHLFQEIQSTLLLELRKSRTELQPSLADFHFQDISDKNQKGYSGSI